MTLPSMHYGRGENHNTVQGESGLMFLYWEEPDTHRRYVQCFLCGEKDSLSELQYAISDHINVIHDCRETIP